MDVWRFLAALVFAPLTAIGALSAFAPLLPAQESPPATAGPERRIDTIPVTYSAEPACVVGRIVIIPEALPDDEEIHPVRAVHAGPGEVFASIDTVRDGEPAARCDIAIIDAGGLDVASDVAPSWSGIVYGANLAACGLDEAPSSRRPYAGQCRWGWVESEIFRPISEPRIAGR
jgi:hypothetical protein